MTQGRAQAPAAGGGAAARRYWPLMRGFAALHRRDLPPDILAGATLAAIAIPSQVATAKLAGMPPQTGFYAFIAGAAAFAVLGSSRRLSVGADSTIAPIFAGALAAMAGGARHYAALAAGLAILTGLVVLLAGVFKLGWIGNLLSVPVTIGFLAGIAVHIVVSQAPAALGVAVPHGAFLRQIPALVAGAPRTNVACLATAAGVLALIAAAHRLSPRIPGALIAVVLAATIAGVWHLEQRGVAVLGPVSGGFPGFAWPALRSGDYVRLAPLAVLIGAIIMVQTATTSRSFPAHDERPDVDRDFVGVGAGSILAAVSGAFAVDASPPNTEIVSDSGGRSQIASLVAAAIMIAVLTWGGALLGRVPLAALAGVLMFVATRLVRVSQVIAVVRSSPAEAALILATAGAIVVLPIEWGVAAGVGLSLLNGLWASARVRVQAMRPVPGSTVWWPAQAANDPGPPDPAVAVLGFAAPLTFINADAFAREFIAAVRPGQSEVRLAILEASGMVGIDFTGGQALAGVIARCRADGVIFAVARLESLAAEAAFARMGLRDLIGQDHIFRSVAEALAALSEAAA